MYKCEGTYREAKPTDYAAVRCDRCNQGISKDDPNLKWRPAGSPCQKDWTPTTGRSIRPRRTTYDYMSESQLRDMRDAGRGVW